MAGLAFRPGIRKQKTLLFKPRSGLVCTVAGDLGTVVSLRSRRGPTALLNGREASLLGSLSAVCLCCSSGRMDGTSSLSLLPRQSLPLAQAQRQWEAMGTALLALLALWGRGLLELVTAEGRELMRRDQCSTGFWG